MDGITIETIDLATIELFAPNTMVTVGEFLLENVRERIDAGLGSDGSLMKPYDPRTVRLRAAKGLETDHRDLRDTGELLDSLAIKKTTATSVKIGWTGRRQQKKAYVNEHATAFVKPTEEERKAAVDLARDLILTRVREEMTRIRAEKGA